jgi:hypothetical protein
LKQVTIVDISRSEAILAKTRKELAATTARAMQQWDIRKQHVKQFERFKKFENRKREWC